jgi:hypothetical protein
MADVTDSLLLALVSCLDEQQKALEGMTGADRKQRKHVPLYVKWAGDHLREAKALAAEPSESSPSLPTDRLGGGGDSHEPPSS